jgi:hypothetical protein
MSTDNHIPFVMSLYYAILNNSRARVEQRIEEMKAELHADGFCMKDFFATESAFLAVLFTFNLLSLY